MFVLQLLLFSLLSFGNSLELICESQVEMGSPFKICVYVEAKNKLNANYDLKKSFQDLHDINNWMSDWLEGTELNKINQSAGVKSVPIRADLYQLLEYSQNVSRMTDGAYDPTFNVFFGLYNFKPGHEREPSDAEIKDRLPLINYKELRLDPNKKTAFLKKPGMKIGLGAIGQGYGVDRIVQHLKNSYKSGYVDGSGDTYFWGTKPDKSLWTTGIRNPFNKESVIAKFYGTDIALTTSGDDEKFFIKDGRRIHHIIDPKTGRPANRVRQVSVVAHKALDADAYDTACFVMGLKKCLSVLKKLKLEAFIITPDEKLHTTPGLIKKKDKWGEYYVLKDSSNSPN